MSTALGKAEAKLRKGFIRTAKKHGMDFAKEERDYGFAVAAHNVGWLAGWSDGHTDGMREGKAAVRARKK